MSKECIETCPRIAEEIELLNPDLAPDIAVAGLLSICQESYDCPGPSPTEVEVTRGFIRKRVETKVGVQCGLE